MSPDRRSAVLTGTFYIIGTVCGGAGLVVALGPLRSAPDYLRAYGTMETRVLIASLLYLMMGVSLVAVAAVVYPVLRKFSPSAAIAYVGARVLEMAVYMLTVVSMHALVALGTEYNQAGAADAARLQTMGAILLGVSNWTGHVVLDVAVFPVGAMVLYGVLFRARLVPRWLSGWGLVSAVLYWASGVLVMFHVITPLETPHILLQAPLGLQEMALAIWLIARGFSASALASVAPTEAGAA